MTVSAGERLRRMLAMVPWIVARPGVRLAEAAERFGVSESELIDDLNVIWMVGLPPYSPDSLVDVLFEDDRVTINYADFFSKPLRLTPAQGLMLLAASDALLDVPGTEPDGPLARALEKLASTLGVDPDAALDVDLGKAEAEFVQILRQAASEGTEVQMTYYSFGRDEHTERTIAPWRVLSSGGAWYVEAWCHQADGERLFRLDRIQSLKPTGTISEQRGPAHPSEEGVFHPRDTDPRVTVHLEPAAAWVADTYPCESVEQHADGTTTVRLVVTTPRWFERLLLILGPDAQLSQDQNPPEQVQGIQNGVHDLASRILDRYR